MACWREWGGGLVHRIPTKLRSACIKQLTLLNTQIKILTLCVNTAVLSDSDLRCWGLNPAVAAEPQLISQCLYFTLPRQGTQVDTLPRATAEFMLSFHKPCLKFVKLHHCLATCHSKTESSGGTFSTNHVPDTSLSPTIAFWWISVTVSWDLHRLNIAANFIRHLEPAVEAINIGFRPLRQPLTVVPLFFSL